jgi:SAM-dependent methyltransferase
MLFTELALIRFGAANQIYLRYFTNFILLASFLGIGVGFLRGRAARNLFPLTPAALLGVLLFVTVFSTTQDRSAGGQPVVVGAYGLPALPIWISLPALFVGVTAAMAFLGEGVARTFVRFEALRAYRLDIVGALIGIAAFTLGSFVGARPVVWGLVIAALLWVTLDRPLSGRRALALAGIPVVLAAASLPLSDRWSPYYKVTVGETEDGGRIPIAVNGLPHQSILPRGELERRQPFYVYPYRHLPGNPLDDVLIVGAGSGNDVAVALRQGAGSIDAVEIDPVLLDVGRERHPDRPYADTRVTAHVDDGRAFLERTDQRFDLIAFALPDSLTLITGQGSLRLESYLFTREALREVREHLTPHGAFTMYNYYRPDVFDRYAATLAEVFGHAPCLDLGHRGDGPRSQAVLTIGLRPDAVTCETRWQLTGTSPEPATDDYPFPYSQGRSIPPFYAGSLAAVLVASFAAIRIGGGASFGGIRPYLDLFAMGIAFLLLETKNVVQFALLFGTTWLVNAFVFGGILLAVYLAIEFSRRIRIRRIWLAYLALLATLVVGWAIPQASLLTLPVVPRLVAATAIAFAPVFLANVVFAQRFRDVASTTVAFGANLLGAMVGGVLEYAALVVGYRHLLLAVAALYGVAFWLQSRRDVPVAATVIPGEAPADLAVRRSAG